jgi:hypothetical protein
MQTCISIVSVTGSFFLLQKNAVFFPLLYIKAVEKNTAFKIDKMIYKMLFQNHARALLNMRYFVHYIPLVVHRCLFIY